MTGFTEERFISLVRRSEEEANRNLGLYKFKLALFAVLGYVVIFTILTVLVALVGGSIAIALFSAGLFFVLLKTKIIFVILFLIWTFLKALWVRFAPPDGIEITRQEAPELFEVVDGLTRSLDALTIQKVLVNEELNAAVVQVPRFGVIGGQTNTLILGIQLLLALSPDEMKSVLAHEIGHLSGNDSKFSGWIYRIRFTWERVMVAFDERNSFGAGLMRRFFDWYSPKFSAYSFALARKNEYQADQMAASLTSSETAAKALVNLHAKAPYIDNRYWDVYFKSAEEHSLPAYPPYEGLAQFLKESPVDESTMLSAIKAEMEVETHYADTHPSLKDRVAALTDKPPIPDSFNKNAAEAWLGDHYVAVLRTLDDMWMNNNKERWSSRYQYSQDSKKLIEQSKGISLQDISDENIWQLAEATSEFVGDTEALSIYQECYVRSDKNIGAAFNIGRILASESNIAALSYLRKALDSQNLIEYSSKYGYDLLVSLEKLEEAEEWWKEVLIRNQEHQRILNLASNLHNKDAMKKADINSKELTKITNQLKGNKKVKAAWIAQKVLPENIDFQCFVIAIKVGGISFSYESALEKIIRDFESDEYILFIATSGDSKPLGKKIKKLNHRIV